MKVFTTFDLECKGPSAKVSAPCGCFLRCERNPPYRYMAYSACERHTCRHPLIGRTDQGEEVRDEIIAAAREMGLAIAFTNPIFEAIGRGPGRPKKDAYC